MIELTVSNVLRIKGLPARVEAYAIKDCTRPNPEYVALRRLDKWTGGVEPSVSLARRDGEALILPRGYLVRLVSRIRAEGLECKVVDGRLRLGGVEADFRGNLRDYQAGALERLTAHGSGVLVGPCGCGKTCIASALISHWRQPSLVLVHTRQLAEQTIEAVKRWLGVAPGLIGCGEFDIQPVTVGIVQSLANSRERLEAARGKFGLVILDEAHHVPASTFAVVLQAFPAAFRYGFTATPERRDGLGAFMELTIGPVRHAITPDELHAEGVLVRPAVEWVRTDFQCLGPGDDWAELMTRLTEDEARNELLLGVILGLIDSGRRIIALSERVKHCERLTSAINALRPGAAEVVTGGMSRVKREAALARVRSGEALVMFSTKLADEGLDLPILDAMVLCTPCRSGGRTMQRVGRVLRSLDGKRQPVVVDVVDPLAGLLRSQARTRFFECYRHIAPGCRLPDYLESLGRAAA